MTEKLIKLVRKHPCLYSKKDKSNKTLHFKTKLWEKIGREINETGEVARKRWKNLRDNYIRYKKETADNATGQAKNTKWLKWPWASRMQFLDSYLTNRERRPNVRQPKPEASSDIESQSPEQLPETPQPEEFLQIKKDQEFDAIDHLFQSYAQTFKSFSKAKQIKAKVELAKLFAKIEAEDLQDNGQILGEQSTMLYHYLHTGTCTEDSFSYNSDSGQENKYQPQ